jgi:hypothetical protein
MSRAATRRFADIVARQLVLKQQIQQVVQSVGGDEQVDATNCFLAWQACTLGFGMILVEAHTLGFGIILVAVRCDACTQHLPALCFKAPRAWQQGSRTLSRTLLPSSRRFTNRVT